MTWGKRQRWLAFQMKTTRKVKQNWLLVTGLACFFHKNNNMFTFFGLRSLLFYFSLKSKSSVRHRFLKIRVIFVTCGMHLRARTEVTTYPNPKNKPGSTPEPLSLTAPLLTWSMKSDSCYNVPWLCNMCCLEKMLWSSATMHSHKCDHVKF